ncbi:hypothetical protein ULMS_29710 [Patiriisocius marinistellae]|uniref:Uncharacterized protein n=1 Tax=Patiriisocius marinistellae TaxID=2494560 RepID=A0A5J4FZC9_9FLAO|nr:hypothetical protein [Patiriisocius marinistellae]GEQ87463.1 hypothetical protein ULMS_29710 [Patiriisocius marinistellae]
MHWKRCDYRIESLRLTIEGLEKSIVELEKKLKEIEWYDGIWFLEEVEPIIGLSFIALQNYINSSIYDRFETLNNQYEKYKIGKLVNDAKRTEIELIIGIANYFKHRDDENDLRKGTSSILLDCGLKINKEIDITESPIIKGLELLTEKWDLSDLIIIIDKWRENLWIEIKKH